ncbi:LysR substrate-binding domain-containing protein, partial [Synechococcus sp. R55.3]
MVAQGLGAAILPRLAAIPIPEGIQIRRLPIPLERVIGAAVLASALHPPAVFAFLEALRGNPSQLPSQVRN